MADNGKLYQDYGAAATASNSNPARAQRVEAQRTNMRAAASGGPVNLREATFGALVPGGSARGAVLNGRQILVQKGAADSGALAAGSINWGGQALFPVERDGDVLWVPRGGSKPTEIENRYGIRVGGGKDQPGDDGGGWEPIVTPGSRARQERMNELSQQAGGPNYSFETGFPREFEAARSAAPVVEQYRKDLASNPLADTPELIDQRSQAYGQRADIAKWLETMQKGSASDQAIAAKFLAKQRPAEQSMADSSVFNATEGDRRVAEAGYSGMKFDPETTRDLKAFEAGADWAASGMAGLKDSKFETGTSEYGGGLLRDGAGIEAARRREIAESGYGSRSISPQDTAELATLGAGSKFTGTGVTHLADMKMTPATAETNRQINFEGSPLPEANAAQAESDNTDKFLANFMKNIGLR